MDKENVIYTARYASPVGRINVAASEAGIIALDFGSSAGSFSRSLKEKFDISPRPPAKSSCSSRFAELFALFDRYFKALEVSFDSVKVDLGGVGGRGSSFQIRLLEELRKVPFGRVVTYSELAVSAGSPRGARAAGGACARNPVPLIIPCHRVISSKKGDIGGYSAGNKGTGLSGVELKKALLSLEGVC